jgi:TolB-like protein
MKTVYLVLSFLLFVGCAITQKVSSNTLDEAIKLSGNDILNNINEQNISVAVINVQSNSPSLSQYIVDELIFVLVKNKNLTIVDRQETEIILQERNFQLSGEVSDESAQSIGKTLGVKLIITGSIINTGTSYRLRVKLLSVETRKIEALSSISINIIDEQISYFIRNKMEGINGRISGPSVSNAIQIWQDGMKINMLNGEFNINDGPFEFHFLGVGELSIFIHACTEDIVSVNYKFPVPAGDIFDWGSLPMGFTWKNKFLIGGIVGNHPAYDNPNMLQWFNCYAAHARQTFSDTRRNESIIVVNQIDISENDLNIIRISGTIYLSIFIDYNNNGIIEENEIGLYKLKIRPTNTFTIFNTSWFN